MTFRMPDIPRAPMASLMLPVMVLLAATFLGMVTVVIGSEVGYRAIYYVAVFSLLIFGCIVVATRRDPLQFTFLSLIAFLPIVDAMVPPGRIGLTVFDVVMLALTIGLVVKKIRPYPQATEQFFPTKLLLIAWLLSLPSVVFSDFPLSSLQIFIENFAIYVFFLLAINELKREGMFERLVLLLAIALLVIAGGIYVEYFYHVNLSLHGTNLNQLSHVAGLEIRRVAGFFQDPIMAGTFLACSITFLLVLSVRGRFSGTKMRFLVWTAIACGLVALVMTVSRAALYSCVLVSGITFFLLNRWNIALKLLIVLSVILLVPVVAVVPAEAWLNALPLTLAQRISTTDESFDVRLMIWFDTWDMFADHPFAGIGLGSFQEYLIARNPAIFNYYGLGVLQGTAYIPSQPESGYFKILYEGGIAGSIAVLLVITDTLRRGFSIVANNKSNAETRTEVIAALAGLATFGVTFVALFTMSDERNAAIFSFFLAVVWYHSLAGAHGIRKAHFDPYGKPTEYLWSD